MLDAYNRRIDYMRISVTDRCNLRCIYCMPCSSGKFLKPGRMLSFSEMTGVIRAAAGLGVGKFRLTGGEPLLRKGVAGFIRGLRDISGIKDLSLTTNGILLRENAAKLFEAGLRRLNVSIDTLDEKKFMKIARRGSLRDVLAGIDKAFETGFSPIKINVVIIRGVNDDEILDFAGLCRERPIYVRFIELMPFMKNNPAGGEKIVPSREIKEKCAELGELTEAKNDKRPGPAEVYSVRGFLGRLGFISPMTNPFCGSCNRLRLTAEGLLRPCLGHPEEIDLRPALRPEINMDMVRELLKKAVELKPQKHQMSQTGKRCGRLQMSKIGG